jgi:PIN domain nuclease of toxin-antitoxin system
VKLLLDSNALIWVLGDNPILHPEARKRIASPESSLFLSVASIWEIEIKRSKGKLRMPADWIESARDLGCTELPVVTQIAMSSAQLPWRHGDPFDRLLVAQALALDLTLVTRDILLAAYGVRVLQA